VFLFDEPLSNLDAALRVNMRMEIARLHSRLGATMAYVTHDQVEAMTLADRIVVLDGGRASQIGTPMELYHRPANLFVAGFIGSPKMNFLKAAMVSAEVAATQVKVLDDRTLDLPLRPAGDARPGQEVTFGIRPEHISVRPDGDGDGIPARIEVVEKLGPQTQLGVELPGGQTAICMVEGTPDLARGQSVRLGLDLAQAHLFGADGLAFDRPETVAAPA